MIVVSYATPKYHQLLDRMESSAIAVGLRTDCEKIARPPDLTWQQACQLKPPFLLKKMEQHQQPILWVDADAVFRESPKQLLELPADCDLCCFYLRQRELLSGTLYFGQTPKAREILLRWTARCEKMKDRWDQKCLQDVLDDVKDAKIVPMPPQYVFIYDTMRKEYPGVTPVIEHFQQSRVSRLSK